MVLPTDIRYGSSRMIPWQHTKLYKWIPLQLSPSRYIYTSIYATLRYAYYTHSHFQYLITNFWRGMIPLCQKNSRAHFAIHNNLHRSWCIFSRMQPSAIYWLHSNCFDMHEQLTFQLKLEKFWRQKKFYLLPVFTRLCKLIQYFYNESYQHFLQRKIRNRLCRTSVVIKLLLILLHSALWN